MKIQLTTLGKFDFIKCILSNYQIIDYQKPFNFDLAFGLLLQESLHVYLFYMLSAKSISNYEILSLRFQLGEASYHSGYSKESHQNLPDCGDFFSMKDALCNTFMSTNQQKG